MQDIGFPAKGLPHITVLVMVREPVVRDVVAINLRHAGFYPVAADSPGMGRRLIGELLPDAVVLDLDAPDGTDGSLLRDLQAAPSSAGIPVVCLGGGPMPCGDGSEPCRAALCIAKPFSPKELVARLSQLLDPRPGAARPGVLQVGPLELDPAEYTIRVHGLAGTEALQCPASEFRLLQYLMSTPDRVHSRDDLVAEVWRGQAHVHPRTVDQNIKRLRTNLAAVGLAGLIETVRGVGYRLRAVDAPTRRASMTAA